MGNLDFMGTSGFAIPRYSLHLIIYFREKKIKISFLIKAGTQKIDYRDVADFSRTILTAKIRASNNLVSAGIQFESNVDVSTSICISRATTIFFDNAIAQEDINKIMERLDVTYKAQITGWYSNIYSYLSLCIYRQVIICV